MPPTDYQVIVIGGGHAGVEAAWAAANLLPVDTARGGTPTVALVTLDPAKIGVMSCNPAIGGLAKGQIVREIDALGGVMGLATDATGINFKVLNTSKGAAVHGPRAQCDKHAYARAVQGFIASRPEIEVIGGAVDEFIIEQDRITGVVVVVNGSARIVLAARAVVLTTGTFMRGLMHTGDSRTPGGRFGEAPAVGISDTLRRLGFELGRLKTGTPPRLRRSTIDWDALEPQWGDQPPAPFSDLTAAETGLDDGTLRVAPSVARFPVLEQVDCRITATNQRVHDLIRANLHRAPMYSGQIESVGPRYCPSIEDKVVRFADRQSHHVFLEPESLSDDWIYCNGISTSLPADVQEQVVRAMPGCARAEICRPGYAVEYDMVRPHQIGATGMTKTVDGLFLAGQINGTSGYEEAAGQGLVAGLNAARFTRSEPLVTLGRDQAYIGVLMDDLVTKTPVEPYRMFTSRAEHRLLLRADNAADRLTGLAIEWGLLESAPFGRARAGLYAERRRQIADLDRAIAAIRLPGGERLADAIRRPGFTPTDLAAVVEPIAGRPFSDRALLTVHTNRVYEAYLARQRAEVRRHEELERRRLPAAIDYSTFINLRSEARLALARFRPETLGQAGRLEGITPADLTLLAVLVRRHSDAARTPASSV
ncbi:MAG: tRNA uridine-5-carboxymethylaminomethyl(34) synthesis enzyme MnmG [Phycisphaeraceae bacterium]|nr:tRNA uridine-5-carboxymethylaminomethyl(34) synthesis enzyme MnmG [Phycisphaeraceae bacterium]